MDTDFLLVLIVVAAAVAGFVLTVVPVFPGTLVIVAGALACGFIDTWAHFGWWFWGEQVVLVALYLLVDNIATWLGVQRVGGTRAAMIGGSIGVLVGPIVLAIVSGPFALLLGPPIGAIAGTLVGEAYARHGAAETIEDGRVIDRRHYTRVGSGAFVAWLISLPMKLVLISLQLALLVLAVW